MNVPNCEKKAFRDMTPEERSVIVEAWIRGDAEVLIGDIDWGRIVRLDPNDVYRTRPRKLGIPWQHIKPEYKWAAMDESGLVFFFCGKPPCQNRKGVWGNGTDWIPSPLNIDTTGIDWRESLTARPEGV